MTAAIKASSDGTQAILQVNGVDKVVVDSTGIISGIPQATVDPLIATKLNASGSAPMYACRAWVNFNGTGTVAIRASGNVSSITDNGAGDYTVNFATAMPDANYSVCGSAKNTVSTLILSTNVLSTGSAQVSTNTTTTLGDNEQVCVAIFR